MAERALRGVGDAQLGEWREHGRGGTMHIRRRLTDEERRVAGRDRGPICVRDIRGTAEEKRRQRTLLRDAPYLRKLLT